MAADPPQLTEFQVELVRTFFTLPVSEDYLLAGGMGLAAHALTTRPTDDLDLFAFEPASVVPALEAIEEAAAERGWTVERDTVHPGFCRLLVHGPQDVFIDLCLDTRPHMPPTMTVLGPAFAPQELAGRKLGALRERGAPRDFADVYVLAQRFGTASLLQHAEAANLLFDRDGLTDAITENLGRLADAAIPVDDPAALRAFYAQWVDELTALPPEAAAPRVGRWVSREPGSDPAPPTPAPPGPSL